MKLDVQKQSEFKTVFQFVQNALDTNSTEEEIEENEHETNRSQKAQFHKERYIAQHPCETLQQVREFVGHIYESDDIDRAVMSHPYVVSRLFIFLSWGGGLKEQFSVFMGILNYYLLFFSNSQFVIQDPIFD